MNNDDLRKELTNLKRYVYGNGEVGLGERVRLLEAMALSIQRGLKLLSVGIFGLFANLAWEILTYYLKAKS